jgi:hypothetical protein
MPLSNLLVYPKTDRGKTHYGIFFSAIVVTGGAESCLVAFFHLSFQCKSNLTLVGKHFDERRGPFNIFPLFKGKLNGVIGVWILFD